MVVKVVYFQDLNDFEDKIIILYICNNSGLQTIINSGVVFFP